MMYNQCISNSMHYLLCYISNCNCIVLISDKEYVIICIIAVDMQFSSSH